MKTDDLINLLAQDAPVRSRIGQTLSLAVVVGILISGAIFFTAIGFRADIGTAMETVRFPFKFVVTIALAVTAGAVVFRIGRPGVSLRLWGWMLLAAPLLLAAAALVELMVMPTDSWGARMIGHNARFCLTFIPLLSIGPLACFLFALRQGAPEKPGVAGAVAGLAASGIAATFYASNCTDDSPLFVLLWYPIAIAVVTAVGYVVGKRMLRW
ncbi:NrsF family protein [Rhizobium mayense]|uniref:NrsF family protein n=1 Tax=Rhizobium mayense TaxID=1312184 RepID=A0ABT7JTN2_9HYPH|nr:NrsF family protein [Rhizobium mayense]MDL2399703.1 NrsF family protein [Rhizobium mayense]